MWFLLFVIVLVVWLSQRADFKRQNNTLYQRGYLDGYESLRTKISNLIERDKVDKDAVRAIIEPPQNTEASNDDQADSWTLESSQSSDVGPPPQAVEPVVNSAIAPAPTAVYVSQTVVSPPPVKPVSLSPKQAAAEKRRRSTKNLNIMLYVGSFLIVAAMASLVSFSMNNPMKLVLMVLVAIAFYVSGLLIHAFSLRLKVAGVAFVGTGLAIVPFIGFALPVLTDMPPETAWLLTSLLGLFIYGFAAVRLQSQLVSYITMAFIVSMSLSVVPTLSLAMVWYFIVVVGVSALLGSFHFLWPKLLPKYFWQPIELTSIVITPVALAISLLLYSSMEAWMYAALFGVSTAHYLVVWLERRKYYYELVIRLMIHLTVVFAAFSIWPMADNLQRFLFLAVWCGMVLLQIGYSLVRVRLDNTEIKSVEAFLVGLLTTILIGSSISWLSVENPEWLVVTTLAFAVVIFVVSAIRFKQIGWDYGAVVVSLGLPYLVLRWATQPAVSLHWVAGIFALLAVIAVLMVLWLRYEGRNSPSGIFFQIATVVYGMAMIIAGLIQGTDPSVFWTMTLAFTLMVTLSYALKQVMIEVMAVLPWWLATGSLTAMLVQNVSWMSFSRTTIFVVSMLVLMAIHQLLEEKQRRNIGVVTAALYGLTFALAGSAVLSVKVALVILLVGAIVALVVRYFTPDRSGLVGVVAVCAYVAYPLAGLALAIGLGQGWMILALAVLTATMWVSSYIEKLPAVMIVGNFVLIWLVGIAWDWLHLAADWRFVAACLVSAGIFYANYWVNYFAGDVGRRRISLISTELMLALAALAYMFSYEQSFAIVGALALLVAAAIMATEGFLIKQTTLVESMVYVATFALQRLVNIAWPEVSIFWYGHWWAAVIVLTSFWRRRTDNQWMVALSFVTLPTAYLALTGHANYSILFLVEHVGLILAGALLRKPWMIWWAIVAVVGSVLYFIRDYGYLMLAFLGAVIIAFVVWRLLRLDKGGSPVKD